MVLVVCKYFFWHSLLYVRMLFFDCQSEYLQIFVQLFLSKQSSSQQFVYIFMSLQKNTKQTSDSYQQIPKEIYLTSFLELWEFVSTNRLIITKKTMKKSGKRVVSLPSVTSVRENNPEMCYVAKSIQNAQRGCYSDGRRLHIDSAYGDHNINLFRLRSKRDYIRNMPTAFSNTIKDLLFQLPKTNKQRRLATEHNEQINKIIDTPKEVYLQKIRLQRQQKVRKQREEREKNKYVIGFDEQLRQVNEQLSFQYLPAYEANRWFKVKDNSSSYQPLVFIQAQKQYFTTPKQKLKKRRGHIFLSDSVRKTARFNL